MLYFEPLFRNIQPERPYNLDNKGWWLTMSVPLEVFCCYAREDQEMLKHLKKHLMPLQRSGQITVWSDTNLNAGVEWEKELHRHLESADIVLLLISPDFMNSDYCYSTEMKHAIERHDQGNVAVIPILLRATLWRDAPFAKLQILPRDARPVRDRSWFDIDEAFNSITETDRPGRIGSPSPAFARRSWQLLSYRALRRSIGLL